MARIAGIDLPKNKRGEIGLTYITELAVLLLNTFLQKLELTLIKK
jgi:small subunit ribosomal protein S13